MICSSCCSASTSSGRCRARRGTRVFHAGRVFKSQNKYCLCPPCCLLDHTNIFMARATAVPENHRRGASSCRRKEMSRTQGRLVCLEEREIQESSDDRERLYILRLPVSLLPSCLYRLLPHQLQQPRVGVEAAGEGAFQWLPFKGRSILIK